MLVLRTLGGLSLVDEQGLALSGPAAQRTRLAILAVIAAAPGGVISRDRLLAIFWPESDDRRARAALRQALHSQRRAAGHLTMGSTELRLNPAAITCDAVEFQQALADGRLEHAAALYAGPFLDGIHVRNAEEFGSWAEHERQRLARQYRDALDRLAHAASDSAEFAAAVRWYEALRRAEPYSGTVTANLMDALVAAGEPEAAIGQGDLYVTRVIEELEVEPDPGVLQRLERIRRGSGESGAWPSLSPEDAGMLAEPMNGSAESETPPRDRISKAGRRRRALAAAGAVAVMAVTPFTWALRAREDLTNLRGSQTAWTILADIQGSAPDDLRELTATIVQSTIDGTGLFVTLPPSQVAAGLRQMQLPDTTTLTPDVARQMAFAGRIRSMIVPVLYRAGSTYALSLSMRDAFTDTVLKSVQVRTKGEDALLAAAEHATSRLLNDLSRNGIKSALPLFQPGSSNPAAYRLWVRGNYLWNRADFNQAQAAFSGAVMLDPDFAYAWCWLGMAYSNAGMADSAEVAFARALESRPRLEGFHRKRCDAMMALHHRDYEAYYQHSRDIYDRYGQNPNNVGLALANLQRYDEAAAIGEETLKLFPFGPSSLALQNLFAWTLKAGRYERAAEVASMLRPDSVRLDRTARLALARGQWNLAEQLARDSLSGTSESLVLLANAQAARGRVRDAFQSLEDAIVAGASSETDRWGMMLLLAMAAGGPGWPHSWDMSTDSTGSGQALHAIHSLLAEDSAYRGRVSPASGSGPESDSCLRLLLNARVRYSLRDWTGVIETLRPSDCGRRYRDRAVHHMIEWTWADAFEQSQQLDSAAYRFGRLAANQPTELWWSSLRGFTHAFAHRRAALLFEQIGDTARALRHWQVIVQDFTAPDQEYLAMAREAEQALCKSAAPEEGGAARSC